MKFFKEPAFEGRSLEFRLYSLNVRFHASLDMCITKGIPHYSLLDCHKQVITFLEVLQRVGGEARLSESIKNGMEERVSILHEIISAFELGRELGPHPTYAEYVQDSKPPIN